MDLNYIELGHKKTDIFGVIKLFYIHHTYLRIPLNWNIPFYQASENTTVKTGA